MGEGGGGVGNAVAMVFLQRAAAPLFYFRVSQLEEEYNNVMISYDVSQ